MIAGFGRDVRSWSNLPWYIRTWNNPTKVDPDGMFQVQVGEWITGFFGKSAHKIPFGKSSSHRACYKPFQKNELDLEILGKLWMGQRNPAPVDRWFIPLFIGFQPSKVLFLWAMFQFAMLIKPIGPTCPDRTGGVVWGCASWRTTCRRDVGHNKPLLLGGDWNMNGKNDFPETLGNHGL